MIATALVSLWCLGGIWCTSDDEFLQRAERAISELVLEDHLLQRVPEVIADVKRALQETSWPKSEVTEYGSLVSGTGLRGSDVDLTVLLSNENGAPAPLDGVKLLRRARRAFQKYPQLFGHYYIPKAKVSVLQCLHLPTGFPIDLTFGRQMSIQNTLMTRYFLQLDVRAYQMAILIKRWGRLSGVKIHQLFTNYNITLLVIFYLQQEGVLPPVSLLQRNTEPYYIGEWNVAFREVRYNTNNNKSLYRLLGGFFQYYSTFDYERYVISVFTGYPVEKTAFLHLDELPAELDLYKHNVVNNISVPLDLSGNFTMLECFEFNLKAGSLLNLQQLKKGAQAFRKLDSLTFLEYLLSEDEISLL